MASPPSFLPILSPARIRGYVRGLPIFTRFCMLLILLALVLEMQNITQWNVVQWGSLIPMEVNIGTMYRANTYPFINGGLLHAASNLLAFVPLMERFEAEHGTLVSVAMFMGPFATFPAFLYILIERFFFRANTAIFGTSVWVFLLLSMEAIKLYKRDPYFTLGTENFSTWISPLVLIVLIWIFIPGTSLLGHLCGCLIGYLFALNYLTLLLPPDRILRFLESRLNLLGRVPHYVSVDQKTYGRYGVLPSVNNPVSSASAVAPNAGGGAAGAAGARTWVGGSGRLGP